MKKLFLSDNNFSIGDTVAVSGEEYHHLSRVLRVKRGESFVVEDISGTEYLATISDIDKKSVIFKIHSLFLRKENIRPKILIFFSLLKGDKNEYLIEKCTELGADEFYPVITKNSIPKLEDVKSLRKRAERFRIIAKEASQQSLREKVPKIYDIMLFDSINSYDINAVKFFGHINRESPPLNEVIKGAKDTDNIAFFVGPEGDFSKEEIEYLYKSGWKGVNISEYILKSDTAAILFTAFMYSYFYKG